MITINKDHNDKDIIDDTDENNDDYDDNVG